MASAAKHILLHTSSVGSAGGGGGPPPAAAYNFIAGYSEGTSGIDVISYIPSISLLTMNPTEANVQILARDSYTLTKLWVRVVTNTAGGNSTVRFRKGGGFGNLIVTIPGGATGVFQDLVNSDTLVDGDLFNWELVKGGAGNSVSLSLVTCLASDSSFIYVSQGFPSSNPNNYFYDVFGGLWYVATEAQAQYRFRVDTTLTRLRVYIRWNASATDAHFFTRINAANGNLNVFIPLGTTGSFEDAVNTDNIVAGDLICYQMTGLSGSGTVRPTVAQMKAVSNHQIVAGGNVGAATVAALPRYFAPQTSMAPLAYSTVELRAQCDLQATYTARNLYVLVSLNSLVDVMTVKNRKNGGDGGLSVTVPVGTTGQFEDNVNSTNYAAGDLANYMATSVDVVNNMRINFVGMELQ